jgi:RNA 2',3'-cyclic 3'-phosphodiesterase
MNKKRGSQSHLVHTSSLIPHPSLRVFCAIELPSEVRARVAKHIAELRRLASDVRASWEHTEKLHITLKFLGEIEESRAAQLGEAAERAARSVPPFDLSIEGTGRFPPRGLPRILWLGIREDTRALARLQHRLEEECESAGFEREARPFNPHITIARLRRPVGARRLAALHEEKGFAPAEFPVIHLIVMRSELGPGGSRYTELSRHPLGER